MFEDLDVGNYVVHYVHGVGQYEGMVKRSIGGIERDYLLVAYKGGDKLYVPSDQVDTLRQYVGGEAPRLNRLGGSDFAKTRARCARPCARSPRSSSCCTSSGSMPPATPSRRDTPWQTDMEDAFGYVETPDQEGRHRGGEGRHGAALPDGPPDLR